jgi:hypothetical protein
MIDDGHPEGIPKAKGIISDKAKTHDVDRCVET